MVTNKDEAKTMTEHISCDLNANAIVQHVILIKKGIVKHVNVNVKIIISVKNSIRNSPWQSANVEAFAEVYLRFLVSALAKKKNAEATE